jgi:hypothetical protein
MRKQKFFISAIAIPIAIATGALLLQSLAEILFMPYYFSW